jgi:hypothetical protein
MRCEVADRKERSAQFVRSLNVRAFLLLGLAAALFGQSALFHEDKLHGRRAFVLENGRMRLSTLPGGGFIGEVRFLSDDPKKSVNPMRVPHYPTIDPFTYDVAKHGDLYGTGIQRRLMSGYMGHFLCFPQFAASSQAEFRQDYGQHGEALAVEWKIEKVDSRNEGVTLRYAADLTKTNYRVERSITLPVDETVAYVEESVENLEPYDRPMQWTQHITFGPPFLELGKTFADGSVAKVAVGRGRENVAEDTWPRTQDAEGRTADLRAFSGHSSTWLMDASKSKVWVTLYSAEYPVLIGYIFESKPNQWVFDWQENQHATEKPWDGKVIARAICIGDSVVSGLRNAVELGSLFGIPTYSWIEARERRTQRYIIFLAEIPLGFKGVAALGTDNGKIVVEERETGKKMAIKSGRTW